MGEGFLDSKDLWIKIWTLKISSLESLDPISNGEIISHGGQIGGGGPLGRFFFSYVDCRKIPGEHRSGSNKMSI